MQIAFNWSCGRKSALEIGPEYQKITAAVGVNQPSIEAFFLDGCLYDKRNPAFHWRPLAALFNALCSNIQLLFVYIAPSSSHFKSTFERA